jgi:hypothetical protein
VKPLLFLLAAVFVFGCATQPLQQKYASYSTGQLQLKRQQLAEQIPDIDIHFGIWGGSGGIRKEKEEIEMELLRRFEAGDQAAELKELPKHEGTKVKAGNF